MYGPTRTVGLLVIALLATASLLTLFGCEEDLPVLTYPDVDREDKLPTDISKRGPETDQYPPILHSDQYEDPVPVDYPVNTAGAEDSPFILPDGQTLYFFFTPDVRVPAEQQLFDDVTGVWVTHKEGASWSKPERVWLQAPGKLSLDGAVCVQDDEMLWFTRTYLGSPGVFRSVKQGDTWGAPEIIVSQFAGEPTLDDAGNLYFVHHFYEDGVMIEADIYVCRRK